MRVAKLTTFANSKFVFKDLRRTGGAWRTSEKTPALIHVNFHPDKWDRMKSIVEMYVNGKADALDKYPVGSCENAPDC